MNGKQDSAEAKNDKYLITLIRHLHVRESSACTNACVNSLAVNVLFSAVNRSNPINLNLPRFLLVYFYAVFDIKKPLLSNRAKEVSLFVLQWWI